MENKKDKIAASIIIALSHLAGLIRVSLVSFIFGSSVRSDILSFNFSLINPARKKIEDGTGNLTLLKSDEKRCESTTLFIILFHAILFLLAIFFSDFIYSLIFKLTSFSQYYYEEGMIFFKTLLVFLVLFSLSSNFNSYLIKNNKKALSSFLTILPSVFSIIFLIFFHEEKGILAFSEGLLAGVFSYLFLSFIFAIREGMRIRIKMADAAFLKAYFLSILLIILSIVESLPFFLSSSKIENVSLYFSNSYTIANLPYAFLIELFTILQFKDMKKGRGDESLMIFTFLSLSISLLLFSFSEEIVSFLFLSSSYRIDDVINTARILSLISPTIFLLSVFSLFQRMMFISCNNKSILFTITLKIIFSYVLLLFMSSGFYKSSLIFLITAALSFSAGFFFIEKWDRKVAAEAILKALICALPLIMLSIFKGFVKFRFSYDEKIKLLLLSLAVGLSVLFLSILILIKMHPKRDARLK